MAILQCVLPRYRDGLYTELASRCDGGLDVLSGSLLDRHSAQIEELPGVGRRRTRTLSFLPSPATLHWQTGVTDWLDEVRPDALICEANSRYLSTNRAIDWMRRRGRPTLGWGYGTLMLARGLTGLRERGRRRFWSRFDAMISYGSRGRDEMVALGLDPARVFVAHNAVASRPVGPPPERDLSRAPPRVLYVGRINRGKKVDLLVRAAIEARRTVPFALDLVGAAPPELLAELRALAAPLGDDVRFHGTRHGEELAALFAAAELFVMPGLGGLGVQEAMAHALPIVVAESDGTHVDLVDDANGWIVTPDDAGSFARAIAAAVGDRGATAAKGAASREKVRTRFNVEAAADGMIRAVEASRRALAVAG